MRRRSQRSSYRRSLRIPSPRRLPDESVADELSVLKLRPFHESPVFLAARESRRRVCFGASVRNSRPVTPGRAVSPATTGLAPLTTRHRRAASDPSDRPIAGCSAEALRANRRRRQSSRQWRCGSGAGSHRAGRGGSPTGGQLVFRRPRREYQPTRSPTPVCSTAADRGDSPGSPRQRPSDEGPYTRRLPINAGVSLANLRNGVVALTKIDRVPMQRLDEVRNQVRLLTAGTFLADARIIVSTSHRPRLHRRRHRARRHRHRGCGMQRTVAREGRGSNHPPPKADQGRLSERRIANGTVDGGTCSRVALRGRCRGIAR